MKLSADLRAFALRLGHDFAEPAHLVRALTHGSLSTPHRDDNQRLEFLGDRVLGLAIAEALLAADARATEGQIAPRFNQLVRRETCAEVARTLDLGAVLKLGRSETINGGRRKEAVLADAMEAVIGAVFLDAGFDVARDLVVRLWAGPMAQAVALSDARDAKTTLQEWAQGRGEPAPSYHEVARSGPDHAPVFRIEVRMSDGRSASAEAGSKRQAEQAAAAAMLKEVGQ